MSEQNALAFLSKVSEDDELAKKVDAAGAESWDEVARTAGFDVTKDELNAAVGAVTAQARAEGSCLSDDDLAKVVGGTKVATIPNAQLVKFKGKDFNVGNLSKLGAIKVAAW